MTDLQEIFDRIRLELEDKDLAREKALVASRKVIRLCAEAIKETHRAEFEPAQANLASARAALDEIETDLQGHADVYFAGFVQEAQKEYAEAAITMAIARGHPPPTPAELRVGDAPYLNGVAEAIGEVRRRIVDLLRDGQVENCVNLLNLMDDLYSAIVTFDYPDAVLLGLRRRTDVARSIIEKTRYDVTTAIRQQRLEGNLKNLEALLRSSPVEHEES